MTDSEAQAEAVRRWGEHATTKRYPGGYCAVGEHIEHIVSNWDPKKFGPLTRDHGWGWTWEEAFALADARPWSYETIRRTP
jgi:hypothetical protein